MIPNLSIGSNVVVGAGVIPSLVKGGDSEVGIAPFDFGAPGGGRARKRHRVSYGG